MCYNAHYFVKNDLYLVGTHRFCYRHLQNILVVHKLYTQITHSLFLHTCISKFLNKLYYFVLFVVLVNQITLYPNGLSKHLLGLLIVH